MSRFRLVELAGGRELSACNSPLFQQRFKPLLELASEQIGKSTSRLS